MPRPRLHDLEHLLDVAEELVTGADPTGLTLRALATEAEVSNGTIYHAFGSKDELVARLWLRAATRLGGLMCDALEAQADASAADTVAAVARTPAAFLSQHPRSAQLFFAQRRDQLFSLDLPDEIQTELNGVRTRFADLLVSLAMRAYDRRDRIAVEAITVCVVDLPSGILRRTVQAGGIPSAAASHQIDAAVRAVLALPLDPPPTRRNP